MANPFEEALKGFKPEKKFQEIADDLERKITANPKQDALRGTGIEAVSSRDDRGSAEREAHEDEMLLSELMELLEIKASDRGYSEAKRLIMNSRRRDVAFDADRFLSFYLARTDNHRAQEITDFILKRGFVSESLSWLRSAMPKGMETGTMAREQRIAKARTFAEAAGVSLEEIARVHRISL